MALMYYRERGQRGKMHVERIDRAFALQLLGQGRQPGPAAHRRLEALERGEYIDPKYSCGFRLRVGEPVSGAWVKRAWIRDGDGRGHFDCPCGQRVDAGAFDSSDPTLYPCGNCGRMYASTGEIVRGPTIG